MAHVKPPYPQLQRGKRIARGLVGAWPFYEGGGSKLHDVSGNNNHGTLTNMSPATDWVAGRHGYALDFDGTDDYVSLADDGDLDLSEIYTISAWINTDELGGTTGGSDRAIYSNYREDNASPYNGVAFSLGGYGTSDGGQIRLFHNDNGGSPPYPVVHSDATTISTDQWYHVAATLDSGDTARIYIDGVEANSGTISETADFTGATPNIGRAHSSASTSNPYGAFNGQIDDVRIYNRALTAKEIALIAAGLG